MATIGREPQPFRSDYQTFAPSDATDPDGKVFDLKVAAGKPSAITVVVGGVIQSPKFYTTPGRSIVFSEAPQDEFFVVFTHAGSLPDDFSQVKTVDLQDYELESGQTSITIDGGYRINSFMLFYNGSRLSDSNYDAFDEESISWEFDVEDGDILSIVKFSQFEVSDTYSRGELEEKVAVGSQEEHDEPDGVEKYAQLDRLHESPIGKGAIVESGSTPDGHYVRWENGEQACWITDFSAGSEVNLEAGSIFRTESREWTFPASFVSSPAVSQTEDGGVGRCWGGLGTGSTGNTTTTFVLFRENSSSRVPRASLTAWGFWK